MDTNDEKKKKKKISKYENNNNNDNNDNYNYNNDNPMGHVCSLARCDLECEIIKKKNMNF